ncbi:hypothetical protein [Acetobacter orleanensis]|uniref:Uncharacterized protein n=1 Tax=Acetobacter orleanensis TaxID=104099 RepID=A0A4Y3TJJ0_9PROT|nr:hypothetical protein [Acetobacter orleanensis]GEB81938.1 hypothetical protein AOR01nite_04150 [Acetobacter orleanensis]
MISHALSTREKTQRASHIFHVLFMLLPGAGYAQSTTPTSVLKVNTPLTASFYKKAPDPHLYDRFEAVGDWTHLGVFTVEHSTAAPMLFEQGTTVTFAYPVKGVQGLDLVLNTFGGHRQTNTGSHVGSAAVTAGVRLKW